VVTFQEKFEQITSGDDWKTYGIARVSWYASSVRCRYAKLSSCRIGSRLNSRVRKFGSGTYTRNTRTRQYINTHRPCMFQSSAIITYHYAW